MLCCWLHAFSGQENGDVPTKALGSIDCAESVSTQLVSFVLCYHQRGHLIKGEQIVEYSRTHAISTSDPSKD